MSGGDDDPVDVATLAELLHETAEHHDSFEQAAALAMQPRSSYCVKRH
jgi:hypothetical protein